MALNREKVLEVAEKLIARGKVDAAIQEYRKLLADNPKDIALLNRVGDLYVRISRNDEAVRLFLQLAARYSEDGFFVKAIAIYKKILKFDPTRLVVYEKLADLYHKQGLANEARAQYEVLVDYHHKHADPRSAAGVLEKMAELDADDPKPRARLAEIYHQLGDREHELREYRTLAELMMKHGRWDEAAQVYGRALAVAPDDLSFVTDAVLGLKDAGQVGAAAKLLAIAVEKNPQAERIARLAGLSREPRAAGQAPPAAKLDTTSAGLRVRDVAPPPPELELRPPEPPAPEQALEPEFIVELPDEGLPSTEVRPTEEMLRRSPESPWFAAEEFVLEIEGVEAEAPLAPEAAAPPAPAAPAPPEIDWSFEAEPELEIELPVLPEVEPAVAPRDEAPPPAEPAPPAPPVSVPFEVGLDLEELERTAYEVAPVEVPVGRRLADLLAEAEVFRKYGLREKAHDRIREILHHEPQHLEAMALLVALLLEEGKHDKALARAQQLAGMVSGRAEAETLWPGVEQKLAKAGYRIEAGQPVAPPAPKKVRKDSVAALLEDLVGLTGEPKKARPAARKAGAAAPAVPETRPAPPPPPARRPAPAPPAVPAPPPPAAQAPPPAAGADEGLGWLEEPKARTPAPPPLSAPPPAAAPARPSADEKLFEDEEGFFDLAAELEEELSKEELLAATGPLGREEPSLEEIVEGFKKGVAESLSAEDYDTHFNLGIAYREMGLIDEAIGEFQLAAKDAKYLIDCCSLLGGCFLDKGLPELAVKWFRKGLEVPDLPEEATLGLLYDLGNLYLTTGERERALKTFVEIYGINSNYRDVVAKLEELGHH